MNRKTAERVLEVKWMSDNKTLLFNQTLDGYTNLYTIAADGNGTIKQLTAEKRNSRTIILNKKRTQAVYLCGRDEVKLIDLKTFVSKTIVKDEIWGFQNSDPGFSPNDEYVVFTAYRNFEQDIFVHNIKENKTTNLTNTGITESSPLWSSDGKFIYFTSQRLKPSYPFGMPNARVYRVALENLDEPYRLDKFNELFKEEKKDTTKKTIATDSVKSITIDTGLIMERLDQISPSLGAQFLQAVYQKGEKTNVLYSSNHGEAKNALWKTTIEPFEERKTEKIAGTDNSFGFDIVEVSDKMYVLFNGTINKLNLEGNKVEPVNISFTFRRIFPKNLTRCFMRHGRRWKRIIMMKNFMGLTGIKQKIITGSFCLT
ncbi:MAG: hypothetical protein WDM90_23215 [Ferruginibacter sp.]